MAETTPERCDGARGRAISATPEPTSEHLRLFTKSIHASRWTTNVSLQAATVGILQDSAQLLNEDEYEEAVDYLATRLSLGADRASALCLLTSQNDLTRALTYRDQKAIRSPDEDLYPHDGWIGSYLDHVSGNESPLAYHFWTAVSIVGAACRRNFQTFMGDFPVFPNHYVLIIGPTGSKKGAALTAGLDIVKRVNSRLQRLDIPEDKRIHLLPNKVGPERIVEILQAKEITDIAADGKTIQTRYSESVGILAIPELSVLMGRSVFHSDVLAHNLTDWYDCPEDWTGSTIARKDERLHNTAITFIACSTLDWIRTEVTEAMFGGGFMSRVIVVNRERTSKSVPRPGVRDPIMANELAKVLCAFATADPQLLDLKDWGWFDDWYHDTKKIMEALADEKMAGYFERRPSHLLRLAMVLSLSKGNTLIDVAELELANDILADEEKRLEYTFGTIAQHEDAQHSDRVLQILFKAGGEITRTKLMNQTVRFLGNARALNNAISTLEARGLVQSVMKERTTVYKLTTEPTAPPKSK